MTLTRPAVNRERLGFIMTQEAGFVSVSRSLRSAVDGDPTLQALWREVSFSKSDGAAGKLHDRLPFLPYHPFGIAQEVGGIYQALRAGGCGAWYTNSLMASYFPRAFRRTPTLYCVDATPAQLEAMPWYGIAGGTPQAARRRHRRYRRFFHSTRLVMAWSEWARQSFLQDYGLPEDRVVVQSPGVDLGYWRPCPPEEARRGGPVRLLFVGADFGRKGGPALLDWFGRQRAGACELHLATREQIAPTPGVHVHRGLKPNTAELRRLFQSADIFVLPTLAECFGQATVEAMAVGLPVVQTDVGGVADIIQEGVNGHIVPPDDPAALDAVLQSLIRDSAKCRRMGQAGRAVAEQKFDLGRNCRRVIETMKSFSQS